MKYCHCQNRLELEILTEFIINKLKPMCYKDMDKGKLNNFFLYHIYCSQDRGIEAVGIIKKEMTPQNKPSKNTTNK